MSSWWASEEEQQGQQQEQLQDEFAHVIIVDLNDTDGDETDIDDEDGDTEYEDSDTHVGGGDRYGGSDTDDEAGDSGAEVNEGIGDFQVDIFVLPLSAPAGAALAQYLGRRAAHGQRHHRTLVQERPVTGRRGLRRRRRGRRGAVLRFSGSMYGVVNYTVRELLANVLQRSMASSEHGHTPPSARSA